MYTSHVQKELLLKSSLKIENSTNISPLISYIPWFLMSSTHRNTKKNLIAYPYPLRVLLQNKAHWKLLLLWESLSMTWNKGKNNLLGCSAQINIKNSETKRKVLHKLTWTAQTSAEKNTPVIYLKVHLNKQIHRLYREY